MASEADRPAGPRLGQIWRFEAFSPEELEACLKPLDVCCRQLQAGRFHSQAEGVFLDTVLVGLVHHELTPKASGMVDPAAIQFHNVRAAHTIHQAVQLTDNCLTMTKPGGDMDLLAGGPCSSLDITVRPDRWIEVAQTLSMDQAAAIPPGMVAIECEGTALEALWRRARWILHAAALYPGCFERREIARTVEVGIVWQLLALLEQPLQRKFMLPAMARRREAIARVAAYIADHLTAPLTLMDLCRIAGLRARALQYAFQETFGVTPMGYLKIVRLTEARRLLRAGDPRTTTVSTVGAQVGFWHMAQFAHDYRALFGERPVETLRGNKT